MAKTNVAVSIIVPGTANTSMSDEIADGSVAAAVEAAKLAFGPYDSDGDIPVITSGGSDFDDALKDAVAYAVSTDGDDLLVFITDGEADDPAGAEEAIRQLVNDGNFVVIVVVNNQEVNTAWLDELDGDANTPEGETNGVDVFYGLDELGEAGREVGIWLAA